jgi:prepilin-type N-terminal cleavage/methylation domain-containing protein
MTRAGRSGFSLVEAMISLLLIGILFVAVLMIFYQTVGVQLSSEDLASANNYARSAVEEVKSMIWTRIPLDETGNWYLDPINLQKPNTYDSEDGEYHIVRTIANPEANLISVTVNVYAIDSPGEAGIAQDPKVTLSTNIYKYCL